MSEHSTTTAVVTTTQKVAALIGGAGMGLSITDVTEWLQLIGAATGAIVGVWMVCDKIRAARKGKKDEID